jgi:hypothetical protein
MVQRWNDVERVKLKEFEGNLSQIQFVRYKSHYDMT